MDGKIIAGVLVLALLAFVGVAYAFPGWYHGMIQNQTNTTWQGMRNMSMHFNAPEMQAFNKAVESGDYQTAQQLHQEYGFGGPIFDKLNETTFAQYSQIRNLQNQLAIELGLNGSMMGMNPHPQGH